MMPALSKFLAKLKRSFFKRYDRFKRIEAIISEGYELQLADRTAELLAHHKNPLNRAGKKCFSQSDEDGITIEILRRMDALDAGTFVEYGVGDGTENNTLVLKALGWRGIWVGGDALRVQVSDAGPCLVYLREWVTADNVVPLLEAGKAKLAIHEVDVISMDLDGNDYYFVERLLAAGVRPKLFITEYNAKFIPPIKWKIDYDPRHHWSGDDYMGASLCAFVDLFGRHGYTLVCCNAHTGTNAFFVRSEFMDRFADVPSSVFDLYAEPRYFLRGRHGHRTSERGLQVVLRDHQKREKTPSCPQAGGG